MELKLLNRNRSIRRFHTEVLPPKSAKSIPFHNRLLSPVKSVNLITSKEDAVHIMATAAKITQPGPQANAKTKLPQVGSHLFPLRVKDMNEKAREAPKQSEVFKGSKKPGVSIKTHRGHLMNKSLKPSDDATSQRVFPYLKESFSGVKGKGKSISLALQAKANVQKREGLALKSSRSLVIQKETSEFDPIQLFKSQSTTENITLQKLSVPNSTTMLRNNLKQNGIVDSGKLPLSSKLQGVKPLSGGLSSAREKNFIKLSATSKVKSNKSRSEPKANRRETVSFGSEHISHKKRFVSGNHHTEKGQDASSNMRVVTCGKVIQSSAIVDRQSNWDQGGAGTDIISFTFNAPMTRLGPVSKILTEERDNIIISAESNSQSKRTELKIDGLSASKFPLLGDNVDGGDDLSTILKKKLTELAQKVEFSQQNSMSVFHDEVHGLNTFTSSPVPEETESKDPLDSHNMVLLEESGKCSHMSQSRKLVHCQNILSPVSVLGHSYAGSCDSLDSSDSSQCTGDSKQCSLIQAQEILSTDSQTEGDSELFDSASSTCTGTVLKSEETIFLLRNCGLPTMSELEYIKEMLCDIELSYNDFALGNISDIINPHLFYRMKSGTGQCDDERMVLFDCASECMKLRCRQYTGGGWKLWSKGVSVICRTERLAEEVYKEITRLRNMEESDTDQVVDDDMSYQWGRWLDFEIEAFEVGVKIGSGILGCLVDEVVADILLL